MTGSADARLISLLSTVFKVPPDTVHKDFSIDNVESWDSLAHLNLVLSIEQEFDVILSEQETVEILSLELIKITLREHGVDI